MPRKLSDTYSAIHQWIRRNFGNPDGVIIDKHLQEAHERGRQEGFKQALKEIELKRHGFLSVDQAHELAETIRTAMEGKDGE